MVSDMKNFWKGKKVFITGHTGFKGSWLLIWLLKKEAQICGYSLKANKNSLFEDLIKTNPNFKYKFQNHHGDINDLSNLNQKISEFKPDIIFHLAAQAIVSEGYDNPIKTWQTNVIGTINLLESLKSLNNKCAVIMVTTDKVYKNKEWHFGYREIDRLGGLDPYSSSKSAAELAIDSWRFSYANTKLKDSRVASVRSGNVVGGGDFAKDRIIPDCVRALLNNEKIIIRNPSSKRPWLHVLEPLSGYMALAEKLYLSENKSVYTTAFNFGPIIKNNNTVEDLVREVLKTWPGEYTISKNKSSNYESKTLNLNIDKSNNLLNWYPTLSFQETIKITVNWYLGKNKNENPLELCISDIKNFEK